MEQHKEALNLVEDQVCVRYSCCVSGWLDSHHGRGSSRLTDSVDVMAVASGRSSW